MANSLN